VRYYGIDIDPERMSVDKLALSMNILDAAFDIINVLDYDTLVEAMYNPGDNPRIVENVLTHSLTPNKV
jgi:hypothetical protein